MEFLDEVIGEGELREVFGLEAGPVGETTPEERGDMAWEARMVARGERLVEEFLVREEGMSSPEPGTATRVFPWAWRVGSWREWQGRGIEGG